MIRRMFIKAIGSAIVGLSISTGGVLCQIGPEIEDDEWVDCWDIYMPEHGLVYTVTDVTSEARDYTVFKSPILKPYSPS